MTHYEYYDGSVWCQNRGSDDYRWMVHPSDAEWFERELAKVTCQECLRVMSRFGFSALTRLCELKVDQHHTQLARLAEVTGATKPVNPVYLETAAKQAEAALKEAQALARARDVLTKLPATVDGFAATTQSKIEKVTAAIDTLMATEKEKAPESSEGPEGCGCQCQRWWYG